MELRLKDHGVTLNIAVWKEDGDIIPAYALDACGLGPYHRGSTQIASLLGFFGSWFIDRSNARCGHVHLQEKRGHQNYSGRHNEQVTSTLLHRYGVWS